MKVFGNWWLWLRSTIYETQCKKNAKTFARKGHFTSRCLKLFAKCHLKTSCQKFSISVLIEAIAHFMIKKNTKVQSATPKNISNDTIITVKKILHTMKCWVESNENHSRNFISLHWWQSKPDESESYYFFMVINPL